MAASKGYEMIRVKIAPDGTVTCDPDPVKCYWEAGPANARWAFYGAPKRAVKAVVEWKRGSGVPFEGHDEKESSSGSQVPDVVTRGNTKRKGAFFYTVKLLAADGTVVAEVDPELDNEANPTP